MTHHLGTGAPAPTVVPLRPRADTHEPLGCTDRSRVLGAVADVLDLVGEAVTAATICAGAALGAALPPTRRVHVERSGATDRTACAPGPAARGAPSGLRR
ncbi:MAG: hypothetical protein AVDCRST_MAG54-802 [uncultured Actinomycetospora sp.]|uniref:Uncharacterized protein n=1 Tax=uncultured Actinomycetospora sp. TaxID=1135996 RepID=A0A6J4HN69_9PSEU|nr:MAG: hypothetical protein AVDCRST_MAG54-802 [uncultured Actinomycetospora sp.]